MPSRSPHLSRYTNLNGDARLRIHALGNTQPVVMSVEGAADIVRLLLSDPDVAEAFRLANLADALGR
jgi:hypothetical protein